MKHQKKLTIVHVPDFREANPYQRLWGEAIDSDVSSTFINKPKGLFPLFFYLFPKRKSVSILHLHWLNPFLRTKNEEWFFLSASRLVVDLLLVKVLGIGVVWTIHNQDVHDSPIKPSSFTRLKWCVLKLANKVVLLNQQDVALLSKKYPFVKEKIFYIPHGNYKQVYLAQPETFFPDLVKEKPVFTFLFFGLIRYYKGVQELMDAWKVFEKGKNDVRLIIAGKFREEAFREEIKNEVAQLDSVVLIDRFIRNEEVHELYTLSDAVTLPFVKINNSGSLILALTFNKPVIAPLFPVVEEYLGLATTYCYSVKEKEGLEKALEKIYSQREAIDSINIENQNNQLDWSLLKPAILAMYSN